MNISLLMKGFKLLPTSYLVEMLKSYCDDYLKDESKANLNAIESISILILQKSDKVTTEDGQDLTSVAKEFAEFRKAKKETEVVVPGTQENEQEKNN